MVASASRSVEHMIASGRGSAFSSRSAIGTALDGSQPASSLISSGSASTPASPSASWKPSERCSTTAHGTAAPMNAIRSWPRSIRWRGELPAALAVGGPHGHDPRVGDRLVEDDELAGRLGASGR